MFVFKYFVTYFLNSTVVEVYLVALTLDITKVIVLFRIAYQVSYRNVSAKVLYKKEKNTFFFFF